MDETELYFAKLRSLGGKCKSMGCMQHRYYKSKVKKFCYYHHNKDKGMYSENEPNTIDDYKHSRYWEVHGGGYTWGPS